MKQHRNQAGFTLVELSIVLVIIGLIVSGVLVGQDMIRAAEIRATVAQVERFDTATNTFRGKYNGLPGDLGGAPNFTLSSLNHGAANAGDDDRLIESGSCTDANGYGGESALFWVHLREAGLTKGAVNGVVDYTAVAAIAAGTFGDAHMIEADLGKGNRFHISNAAGRNYYGLGQYTATTITTCALTSGDAITPLEAFQIDEKIDDGNAATGIVLSLADAATLTGAPSGGDNDPITNDQCYDIDGNAPIVAGAYNTSDATDAESLLCQLRIRASF